MITEFIDGLQQFHFLQNALITAIAIGIVAGAVGCFIILRGMSLMGDAISHAVLPGVALSFILGINFFIGAIVFGLLASILITYIKSNSIIKSDTAIGITFSSFLALGVILIVHHDLSKVPAYFDQVLLLHRKLIAFGKTEETFTKENLHAAYGHELFIGGEIR